MKNMNHTPAPAAPAPKAPAPTATPTTNSTQALVKLVTAGITSTTKKTETKIKSAKKVRGKIFRTRTDETPSVAMVSKLTKDNPISDKKYDTKSTGSDYIQGIVGTPLADAPSVGATVGARLKRLSQSVEPKIQQVVAGLNSKLHRISTGNVAMTKKMRH